MSFIRSVARAVLPQAVRREIHHRVHAVVLRRLADRAFLEGSIVPWLDDRGIRNVLSIGVRAYTAHYPDLLARRGITMWTSDIDPEAARWASADRHVVADVCALSPRDFPLRFDAVLYNGVVGWGVDAPEAVVASFRALHSLVAPGALMVFGWNDDRSADPLGLDGIADLWEPIDGPHGATRRRFDDVTHVYDFLRARPLSAADH